MKSGLFNSLAALTVLVTLSIATVTNAQEALEDAPAHAPRADVGKRIIELPVEDLLAQEATEPKEAKIATPKKLAAIFFDQRKARIELPLEALVIANPQPANSEDQQVAKNEDENPACQPGLVKWHDDLSAAKAASEKSGKPLLVFQLLGQLDQQFT